MARAYLGKSTKLVKKHGRTKYKLYKRIMYISLFINLVFIALILKGKV